jgi:hypothetical protein
LFTEPAIYSPSSKINQAAAMAANVSPIAMPIRYASPVVKPDNNSMLTPPTYDPAKIRGPG